MTKMVIGPSISTLLQYFLIIFLSIHWSKGEYLTASPSWFSAFTLLDNTTIIGWNEMINHQNKRFCFSIDYEQGLHCIQSNSNFQKLPFKLTPGEHFLHISNEMEMPPTPIAIYVQSWKPGIQVLFTSPAFGANIILNETSNHMVKTKLEILFNVINLNKYCLNENSISCPSSIFTTKNQQQLTNLPKNTFILIKVAGQGEFEVHEDTNTFVLSGIEPATHFISAQILNSENREPLGEVSELLIEAIFSKKDLQKHQYHHLTYQNEQLCREHNTDKKEEEEEINMVSKKTAIPSDATATSKLKNIFNSLFNGDSQGSKAEEIPSNPAKGDITEAEEEEEEEEEDIKDMFMKQQRQIDHGPRLKIKLTFVGVLKYDGQKVIWLHQMQYFNKEEFDITFVTFSREHMDSPVIELMKQFEVNLIIAPFPAIPTDTIFNSFEQHYNQHLTLLNKLPFWLESARKVSGFSGDLTMQELDTIIPTTSEALNEFLVGFLKEAGGRVEDIRVEWVKQCWLHCIHTLQRSHVKLDGPTSTSSATSTMGDILVYANARDFSDVFLAQAARLAGARKVVMDLPNLFPPKELSVDAMVAPSHYVKTHPSVTLFQDTTRIVVINPGVNTKLFRPSNAPNKLYQSDIQSQPSRKQSEYGWVPVIGFLARFSPEKSPGIFIAAAKIILKVWPIAKFVIIGEGALQLETYVEMLGISKQVEFKGGIYDQNALVSEIRSMTVVVNPSLRAWSETFCIANIEVMATGVPLVSFGVGGVQEYLHDGITSSSGSHHYQNGVIVNEATAKGLADGVLWFLSNRTRREKIAASAHLMVHDLFTIEREVEAYRQLYISLLQE